VNELFPGRYSALKRDLNTDTDTSTKSTKTKSNLNGYALVVSNMTEVGLLNNLAKVNTMLLHTDGDVALNKLG
jgi:hypothetical protein